MHDSRCFYELVLSDMPSCSTRPAGAAATYVALFYIVFSFRIPSTYRSKITRASMYPITIRSILALNAVLRLSHAWCLLHELYNGHGTYYKYTWNSIRCFTSIARGKRRCERSNGCSLSMCISQQRQLCGFKSVDDASLTSGKEESSVGGKYSTRDA